MSSVKQFELFHGLVLVKILRGRGPSSTLHLIEANTQKEWATYKVNDVRLLVKYSEEPREAKTTDAKSWVFSFGQAELGQLREAGCRIALVCGLPEIRLANDMQICFPSPEQIRRLLDASSPEKKQQSLTVRVEKGKSLQISFGKLEKPLVVSRSALDNWAVPGG